MEKYKTMNWVQGKTLHNTENTNTANSESAKPQLRSSISTDKTPPVTTSSDQTTSSAPIIIKRRPIIPPTKIAKPIEESDDNPFGEDEEEDEEELNAIRVKSQSLKRKFISTHHSQLLAGSQSKKVRREIDQFIMDFDTSNRNDQLLDLNQDENATRTLWIGNIKHNDLTEHVLLREYSMFGRLVHLKIMWPRNQAEYEHTTGTIQFVNIGDAENCLQAFRDDNVDIQFQPDVKTKSTRQQHPIVPYHIESSDTNMDYNSFTSSNRVYVTFPTDSRQKQIIDTFSQQLCLSSDPIQFEKKILDREVNNPLFKFLKSNTEHHLYYKWRVYSLMNGDTLFKWRSTPFQLYQQGPLISPPISAQNNNQKLHRRLLPLRVSDCEDLSNNLSKLTVPDRNLICNIMIFAIDHADSADQIVNMLCQQLTETSDLISKYSVLYLISDILFNASILSPSDCENDPSLYKEFFFPKLTGIFNHLSTFPQLKRKVENVLDQWEKWRVFECSELGHWRKL